MVSSSETYYPWQKVFSDHDIAKDYYDKAVQKREECIEYLKSVGSVGGVGRLGNVYLSEIVMSTGMEDLLD